MSEAESDLQVNRNPDVTKSGRFGHFYVKQPKLGCSSACVKVFCMDKNRLCVDPPNVNVMDETRRSPSLQPSAPDFHGLDSNLDGIGEKQTNFSTPLLPLPTGIGEAVQVRFLMSSSISLQ